MKIKHFILKILFSYRLKSNSFVFCLILSLLSLLFIPSFVYSEHIIISGCSVSNVGYLSDLAKEYEKRTGIKVLARGGGSVLGLEELTEGKVDMAAACRKKIAEDPADIEFIQVAWDALVFIVHKSNPINNITMDDAISIYKNQINNWEKLKGNDMSIKVFIVRPGKGLSGVEASVKEMILKGEEIVVSPNIMTLASAGIVEQIVEKTPEGFATTGFSSARKRDVKMLKLDGISPTKENIIMNRYPLKRPLFILAPKNPKQEVKEFIDFVLSKDGQQFISGLGMVSLLDMK